MLVVLGLVGVLLALTLPGVSGSLVVQPSLVVAAGAVLAALLERRTVAAGIAYLLALAVAAMMLGPAVWIGFDIGLGTRGPASAAQLAVFVLLALPLIEFAWPYRPGSRGAACALQRFRPFCCSSPWCSPPAVCWPTGKERRMPVRRCSCTPLTPTLAARTGRRRAQQ